MGIAFQLIRVNFAMEHYNRIIKESGPVLFMSLLGGLIAGFLLNSGESYLELVPGLLVLLPGILALRGNIGSALGSRLGSALHLGLIESEMKLSMFKNQLVKENILASLTLNIIMSALLGILAFFVTSWMGVEGVSATHLVLISLLAGFISGVFLMTLTIMLAVYTASAGLEPDNVLTPSVATIGDMVTIIFLFLSAEIVLAAL
jgi:mgtE-like transporter